jgi:type IV secretion system protein TrbI
MADELKRRQTGPGAPSPAARHAPPKGPSGMDLNPKPDPTRRVSKRGGMILLFVMLIIVSLIIYGIFSRGKGPLAKEPQGKLQKTTAATETGDQIAKSLLTHSKHREGVENTPEAGSGNPDELQAPPLSSRVRPGMGRAGNGQPPQHILTAAEREREDAYKAELEARNAPMGINGSNSSGGAIGDAARATANPLSDALKNDAALTSLLHGQQQAAGAGAGGASLPGGGPAQDDQNKQEEKASFIDRARSHPEDGYLKSTRTNPIAQYEIKAGWDIPAVLEQGINSDLPGEIKALVRSNVYDTATGQYLLIPQGSRLIGTYNHRIAYGQSGIQVIWTRMIYPDGTSIDLDGMIGQDAQGNSGFRDKVDNHYARLIGFALLTSAFSAGIELSQNQNQYNGFGYPSNSQIVTQALGQQMGELGMEVTRRNLNIQPTIKIRVGYRFNVRVNRDIAFEAPYQPIQN